MITTSSHSVVAGLIVGACCALACVPPAHAAPTLMDGYKGTLVLGPTSFAEADVGTTDPSATFSGVPGYGSLTISYGPYFSGQSYGFDPNNPAPPVQTSDAATGPLTLASDPNLSAIVEDDADATSNPVVGGTVFGAFGFIGPVAVLFSTPVVAAEVTVGDLAASGQVTLEAFAADGSSLGSLVNTGVGYETFDLSSTGGDIAGLSVRSTDSGSAVDAGLSGVGVFGNASPTPVPAPGASVLILAGAVLAGVKWSAGRRARSGLLPAA